MLDKAMLLVGLRIRIEGFWACRVSEVFKGAVFRVLDIHPSMDYSRGLLAVSGVDNLPAIVGFLSSQREVDRVEILLEEPESGLISLYFKHGPLGEAILKTGVHIRPPLILEGGDIKVNLIGKPSSINSFLKDAEGLSEVQMEVVRKSELRYVGKPRLTRRQEMVLREAVRLGYFDLPRRITIMELAVKVRLSPSTVAEHLRKAENKIVKDYF